MNAEKKLDYFSEIITKEVEAKKRKARRQMAAEAAEAISHATAKAETEANTQIEAERQATQKSNNKRISEADSQARRALAALREQLTAQLFDDIKSDIIAFTTSPDYENFLINSIQVTQSQIRHPFTYIQLPPSTFHLSSKIQEVTGLTPEPGGESDIGGFILLSANRSMASDNTFKSSLEKAKEAFCETIFNNRRTPWQKA